MDSFFIKAKGTHQPWVQTSIYKGESLEQAAERLAKLIYFQTDWNQNNFTIAFSRDANHVMFEVDVTCQLTVQAEVARRV